jgi:hypothetical protein
MAQWGNQDTAADSVSWANTTLNVTQNQTEIFGNVTEDDVITDMIVGQFGVSATEMSQQGEAGSEADAVTHAGWVLRKEGTGGRAGRVQYETLVAGGSITGDTDADDTILPES